MEFLRGIFGRGTLTFEQLSRKLAAEGIKLANLAEGEYVGIGKYQALRGEYSVLQGQVEALDTALTAAKQKAELADSTRAELVTLQGKLAEAARQYQKELADREFSRVLEKAIREANGRNPVAIAALLDTQGLRFARDLPTAVKEAVAALKKTEPYLFEGQKQAPPFAAGTGTIKAMVGEHEDGWGG